MATNPVGLSLCFFGGYEPGFDIGLHPPAIAANGFACVEIGPNAFGCIEDDAGVRRTRAAFEQAGVAVNSVHTPFGGSLDISSPDPAVRGEGLRQARWCLERLRLLGGRCLIVHSSAEPIGDDERPARIRQCVESLRLLADDVDPDEVALLAVEILPRTCLGHDSDELLRLLEPFDPRQAGVCFDVNHANLREDVLEATRRLGHRIVTTHISDNDGDDEKHWLPGRGILPWKDWLDALVATGYGGPLVYELGCQNVADPAGSIDAMLAALWANAEEYLLRGER